MLIHLRTAIYPFILNYWISIAGKIYPILDWINAKILGASDENQPVAALQFHSESGRVAAHLVHWDVLLTGRSTRRCDLYKAASLQWWRHFTFHENSQKSSLDYFCSDPGWLTAGWGEWVGRCMFAVTAQCLVPAAGELQKGAGSQKFQNETLYFTRRICAYQMGKVK